MTFRKVKSTSRPGGCRFSGRSISRLRDCIGAVVVNPAKCSPEATQTPDRDLRTERPHRSARFRSAPSNDGIVGCVPRNQINPYEFSALARIPAGFCCPDFEPWKHSGSSREPVPLPVRDRRGRDPEPARERSCVEAVRGGDTGQAATREDAGALNLSRRVSGEQPPQHEGLASYPRPRLIQINVRSAEGDSLQSRQTSWRRRVGWWGLLSELRRVHSCRQGMS